MAITTIEQAIHQGVEYLSASSEYQTDTPRLDCEIVLLTVLNLGSTALRTKSWLLTWPEHPLSNAQFKQYQMLLAQRAQGKPIAYITGEKDFWSFTLKVTPDTLIPRPETELLVESALEKISLNNSCKVLDLGTGSGAIALAIASERPQAQVIASDYSQQALNIAIANARELNLSNIQFCLSSWFRDIAIEKFDVIVSNPPYIAPDDPQLEANVKKYEPLNALFSEQRGLKDIIDITENVVNYTQPGSWLMLEHGYTQNQDLQTLFKNLGLVNIETRQDLNHLPRVTMGQFPHGALPPPRY